MFIRRKVRKQVRVAVSINECFDVSLKMIAPLPKILDCIRLEWKMHVKPERTGVLTTRYPWGGHKQCSEGPAQLLAATAVGHKHFR